MVTKITCKARALSSIVVVLVPINFYMRFSLDLQGFPAMSDFWFITHLPGLQNMQARIAPL